MCRMNPSLNKKLSLVSFSLAVILVTISLFAQDGNAGATIVVA
jgi:hypothetical protein